MNILQSFKSFIASREEDLIAEGPMAPGEWLKPNSKTGELRLDILARLVKDKTPLELDAGGTFVVTKQKEAYAAIAKFQQTQKAFMLIGKIDGKGKEVEISSSKLKKSAVFGSGGGTAGGSANTALAESAQAVYCSAVCNVLGAGASPEDFNQTVLKKAYMLCKVDVSLDKILNDLPPDWVESSILTAQQLFKEGYIKRGHVFYRGVDVMKDIYLGARKAQANSGDGTVIADDKWNPGDIWAAERTFNAKALDTSTIDDYNKDILESFLNRSCVAISLKKVVKAAHITRYNIEPAREQHKYLGYGLSGAKGGGTIKNFYGSKSTALYVDDLIMEGRTFNYMSGFAVDIRGAHSRGGKIGLAPINKVLAQHGVKPISDAAAIKSAASKFDPKFIKDFYKLFSSVNPWGHIAEKQFTSDCRARFEADTTGPDWLLSKYMATELIARIDDLPKAKQNKVISSLLAFAASSSDVSSAFIKVS